MRLLGSSGRSIEPDCSRAAINASPLDFWHPGLCYTQSISIPLLWTTVETQKRAGGAYLRLAWTATAYLPVYWAIWGNCLEFSFAPGCGRHSASRVINFERALPMAASLVPTPFCWCAQWEAFAP